MLIVVLVLLSLLLFYKLFKQFGKTREIIIDITPKDAAQFKAALEKALPAGAILIEEHASRNPKLPKNLAQLQEKFVGFDMADFLEKAEMMFDNIFNAFVQSNYNTLKLKLTEPLFESFTEQIQKREKYGLGQEILIRHKKTTLEKIQLLAKKAKLLVSFDVSQMSAMINEDGTSSDNPKRLYRDVTHKWTFETGFDEQNWILSKISSVEQ